MGFHMLPEALPAQVSLEDVPAIENQIHIKPVAGNGNVLKLGFWDSRYKICNSGSSATKVEHVEEQLKMLLKQSRVKGQKHCTICQLRNSFSVCYTDWTSMRKFVSPSQYLHLDLGQCNKVRNLCMFEF